MPRNERRMRTGAPHTPLRPQTLIAATLLALGLALTAMMVVVEGEPGALPLLLVLAGGVALFALRRRARRPRGRAARGRRPAGE